MTGAKSFRDFVEKQHARARSQDARDRQHLLLTAGNAHSRPSAYLLEIRKHLVDFRHAHAALAQWRRQHQIFLDAQICEDAALLGAIAEQSYVGDTVGRHVDDLAAAHGDRTASPIDQSEHGAQRRRAAGAVAPQQRHHLALVQIEVDAVEHMRLAVEGVEIANRQQRLPRRAGASDIIHLETPRSSPYRPPSRPDFATPLHTRRAPGPRRD